MKKLIVVVLLGLFTATAQADIVIQAESATYDGKVASNHTGYTGSGFVDVGNNIGSWIEFEFSVKDAMPNAEVVLRWANGKDDSRNVRVDLNGVTAIADQALGYSGSFTTWSETPIILSLRKGTNKIRLTSLTSVGGPNYDKLTIVGAELGKSEFELMTNVQGKGSILRNPDAPFYEEGTVVTLTAVPNSAFEASFVGWSGDASGTALTTTITINAKKTVTATFKSGVHASFYCAPKEKGGDDNNAGTIDAPFYHLEKALALMEPGDTVFMRGGTYNYTQTIALDKRGSKAEYLSIFAYENEQPVLDFYEVTGDRGSGRGFKMTGDYYYMKGLEICYAPDNGIKVEGSHNIMELLRLHHNGDSGIQIGLAKNSPDGPDIVCHNLVKNCDSWRNFDWGTGYENADGFACKLSPGPGNRFVGCRAWENADDGWDFYMTHYPIYVDSCWTFGNGNEQLIQIDSEWKARYPNAPTSWAGDGNGFKLGGDDWAAKHEVSNSIAFDGYVTGACFSENNNADSLFIYNCVAWQGLKNFRVRKHASDIRNCISFDPKVSGSGQLYDIAVGSIELNNTWNSIDGEQPMVPYKEKYMDNDRERERLFDQTTIYDEFVSTSVEDFLALREPDGSLPNNGFGRLKAGSRFIDKGSKEVRGVSVETYSQIPIQLAYSGSAPDLGAYEYYDLTSIDVPNTSDEQIFSNYPNPFKETTTFNAVAQEDGWARIVLYNISGMKIQTICERYVMRNEQIREVLSAAGLEKGIYMVLFQNGKTSQVRKIVRL